MDAKLSIITPSLNQGAFIERTIRSVLDQGYPNLEYVIVDGGSTDETLDIIRRYEDRLAWWISEPDLGQSDAVNKGIQGTSGDIVAYLNSDDYYLPGTFELVARAFEESEAGWVAGASIDIEEGDPGVLTRFWAPVPPSHCEGDPPGRHHWMLVPWHVPQPSVFWRREMFERFGLLRPDMHFAFDAEFMLRLAYGGEFPERLPDQVLSVRSVHPGQKTYDMTNSWPEIRRFKEIFMPTLTLRERVRLRLPGRPSLGWFRRRLLHPLLRFGGDALEYVPERIRPPIRTRDRRPRARSRPVPQPPRFPASPVGITDIRTRSPIPGAVGRNPVP